MSEKRAIEIPPIYILGIIGFVIMLMFLSIILRAGVGRRSVSLVGTVLVGATGYTGIFKGLVIEAFKGIGSLLNF